MKKTEIQRFAKNMKNLRKAKGLSQGDIHRATEIDRAYYSGTQILDTPHRHKALWKL